MTEYYVNTPPDRTAPSPTLKKRNGDFPATGATHGTSPDFREVLKKEVQKTGGTGEIRQDLVNKYKTTLADGTYEIKAGELAEKMVQKIRESKTGIII